MKKSFFVFAALVFFYSFAYAEKKEEKFIFGDSVFQFEESMSYYSGNDGPLVWKKLFFVNNEERIELLKGDDTTFDLIDSENISKNGAYFMITYLRDGYAGGDRQYCALINTTNGCVFDNSSWYPICDGEWSQTDGSTWIYYSDSIDEPEIIEWNLDDEIKSRGLDKELCRLDSEDSIYEILVNFDGNTLKGCATLDKK